MSAFVGTIIAKFEVLPLIICCFINTRITYDLPIEVANQAIQIFNLRNKGNEKELLTAEEVELLTTPTDLATFKDAITQCLYKGTKRNVESDEQKNGVDG